MPRRALFIVITDNPGGAERVSLGLASALSRRADWESAVTVVCRALPNSFSGQILPADVKVHYGPARNPFWAFPLLLFRLLFRRYDLVVTTHIYTNALVSMMRRLGLVRIDRLVMRESMSLFDRFAGAKAKLFALLYRCYGGEDLLIVQTGYMADHVRPWLPARSAARLRSLSNPVDLAAIDASIAGGLQPELAARLSARPSILFCGRFVDFKRPDVALEVFRLVKKEREDAQLVFMGSGPLDAGLRERAAKLGLGEDVLFLGQVRDPYPVMAECQYGLLTSANEGFPNVILEMMACAMKRIVVTPCADGLDALSGVIVTGTHDPAEIASALLGVLRSQEDFGQLYRAVVARRSIDVYVDQLIGNGE